MFAKLHKLLKLAPDCQDTYGERNKSVEHFANRFYPTYTSVGEPRDDEDANLLLDNNHRKVSIDNLVFLWGFGDGVSASELKCHLQSIHPMFSEGFELHLVDRTCSVIVFESTTSAQALIKVMESGEGGSSALGDMIADGLKGAGYGAYKKVCQLGLWEANLADSLEAALAEHDPSASSGENASVIYWNSELMIDLNDL